MVQNRVQNKIQVLQLVSGTFPQNGFAACKARTMRQRTLINYGGLTASGNTPASLSKGAAGLSRPAKDPDCLQGRMPPSTPRFGDRGRPMEGSTEVTPFFLLCVLFHPSLERGSCGGPTRLLERHLGQSGEWTTEPLPRVGSSWGCSTPRSSREVTE